MIKRNLPLDGLKVREVMTSDPKVISSEVQASEALEIMERHLITVLPIVDARKRVLGILHLHDLLGKGEFKFR